MNVGTVYESNNPRDNGRRIVIVANDPRSDYVVARSTEGRPTNLRKTALRDQPPYTTKCYRRVEAGFRTTGEVLT